MRLRIKRDCYMSGHESSPSLQSTFLYFLLFKRLSKKVGKVIRQIVFQLKTIGKALMMVKY
jgi:hypothetical protein